jgi:putative ABC transport system ATP-binding protein
MENVMLPLTFYRKPGAGTDVLGLLKLLGIDHRKDHLPGRISGGEMQRVAIARSLINSPEILLADEPTGNLDTKRSAEIVRILKDLSRNEGLTVIMVSHNPELAGQADRQFEMRDGGISEKARWPIVNGELQEPLSSSPKFAPMGARPGEGTEGQEVAPLCAG